MPNGFGNSAFDPARAALTIAVRGACRCRDGSPSTSGSGEIPEHGLRDRLAEAAEPPVHGQPDLRDKTGRNSARLDRDRAFRSAPEHAGHRVVALSVFGARSPRAMGRAVSRADRGRAGRRRYSNEHWHGYGGGAGADRRDARAGRAYRQAVPGRGPDHARACRRQAARLHRGRDGRRGCLSAARARREIGKGIPRAQDVRSTEEIYRGRRIALRGQGRLERARCRGGVQPRGESRDGESPRRRIDRLRGAGAQGAA